MNQIFYGKTEVAIIPGQNLKLPGNKMIVKIKHLTGHTIGYEEDVHLSDLSMSKAERKKIREENKKRKKETTRKKRRYKKDRHIFMN